MKLCIKCQLKKSEEEFPVRGNICTPCKRLYQRQYRRDQRAIAGIKKKTSPKSWRLTPRQKAALARKQGDRCLICKRKKFLVQDHCHREVRFRGLICQSCNIGLGQFGDNPKRLRRAIRYLEGTLK